MATVERIDNQIIIALSEVDIKTWTHAVRVSPEEWIGHAFKNKTRKRRMKLIEDNYDRNPKKMTQPAQKTFIGDNDFPELIDEELENAKG